MATNNITENKVVTEVTAGIPLTVESVVITVMVETVGTAVTARKTVTVITTQQEVHSKRKEWKMDT